MRKIAPTTEVCLGAASTFSHQIDIGITNQFIAKKMNNFFVVRFVFSFPNSIKKYDINLHRDRVGFTIYIHIVLLCMLVYLFNSKSRKKVWISLLFYVIYFLFTL